MGRGVPGGGQIDMLKDDAPVPSHPLTPLTQGGGGAYIRASRPAMTLLQGDPDRKADNMSLETQHVGTTMADHQKTTLVPTFLFRFYMILHVYKGALWQIVCMWNGAVCSGLRSMAARWERLC